jgi:hypothetical protein
MGIIGIGRWGSCMNMLRMSSQDHTLPRGGEASVEEERLACKSKRVVVGDDVDDEMKCVCR